MDVAKNMFWGSSEVVPEIVKKFTAFFESRVFNQPPVSTSENALKTIQRIFSDYDESIKKGSASLGDEVQALVRYWSSVYNISPQWLSRDLLFVSWLILKLIS